MDEDKRWRVEVKMLRVVNVMFIAITPIMSTREAGEKSSNSEGDYLLQ